jgi:hypothetical protein
MRRHSARKPAVSYPLSAPRVKPPLGARIVPLDHLKRRLALGAAGGFRGVGFDDETVPLLGKCVADIAELRRRVVALAVEIGVGIGRARAYRSCVFRP